MLFINYIGHNPDMFSVAIDFSPLRLTSHSVFKAMYDHLELALQVLEEGGFSEEADTLTAQAARKFSASKKVWIARINHVMLHATSPASSHASGRSSSRQQLIETVLETALKSLPARKHVAFISRSAVAAYKVGDIERGRALFEGLMRHHPKRLDLWVLYADQEVGMCRALCRGLCSGLCRALCRRRASGRHGELDGHLVNSALLGVLFALLQIWIKNEFGEGFGSEPLLLDPVLILLYFMLRARCLVVSRAAS